MAATFSVRDENGSSLADVARLDTMVTVVDARNLLRDYASTDFLRERGESLGAEDHRNVVDLLVDQIEFADTIIVNKISSIGADQRRAVFGVIKALNPGAGIVTADYGRIPLARVLDTHRFDFEQAERNPGWARELAGIHTPETDEYGIASFVYRERRPFHPQRLMDLFHSDWAGVVRAKGFFWLASRPDFVGELSQAGSALQHQAVGLWWASPLADEIPPPIMARLKAIWHADWGDRRQELVFIGIGMDEIRMRRRLDECLLTDAEFAAGQASWRALADPFPEWDIAASDESES